MKTLRKNTLRTVIFLTIVVASISCLDNSSEYYVRFTGPVEIIRAVIPDTVDVNSYNQLVVNAQANNGCWSNLNFLLNKTSNFEYTIQAFGMYESTGSCTDVKVNADTSIIFQPTAAGLYKFYVTKSETVTEIDTMIVK
jgi:hypothetical protein